jgi:hypothetical protein
MVSRDAEAWRSGARWNALLRGLRVAANHGLILMIGLASAFRPTLLSGFTRLQADPGDTLLNGYVLEHSWRWLTQSDYAGSFWSPRFFYPQTLALAYSENLLGAAPLYWLLRTVWPAMMAYQLWMMLVASLTYVSFAVVLRRLGVGMMLAALGGFVFAFGLPRVAQVGHQQLLPHLFAPWAVLAAWTFLQRSNLAAFAGLLAASFAQLLASLYLGWFLLAGLALFAAVAMLLDGEARRSVMEFSRRHWAAVMGLIAVWVGLVALLLAPYWEANRGFRRDYSEVLTLTPRPESWLASAPQGVWYGWLPEQRRETDPELWIFPGLIPLAACGLAMLQGRKRLSFVAAMTAIVLVLLAMRWGDWSAWRFVFRWIPGGAAIRAVGRVVFTVELFALIGGLVAADALLRRIRLGGMIAGVLLAVGIAEQIAIRELPSFEVAPWQARVEALKSRLTPGTAGYIDLSPDRPFWENQVTVMWAGLEANVPVVNGYSGRYPPGYPDWTRTMTDDELSAWMHGAPVVRIAP